MNKKRISDYRIYALIPARGGSVSIPKKNLCHLKGKPLLSYPILTAQQSQYIQKIYVSSDDDQIRSMAIGLGAEAPFKRPAEFSTSDADDLCVFKHFLHWLSDNQIPWPDFIVHLRATAPIRSGKVLDRAIEQFVSHPESSALRSVSFSSFSPYKMWEIDEAGFLTPILTLENQTCQDMPRQRLPKTYQQDGYVDIVRPSVIMQENKMGGDKILAFLHDTPNNDIDDMKDLKMAEYTLQETHRGLKERLTLSLHRFGIIQGRLTPSEVLQQFPNMVWEDEFRLAKELGLSFIELLWDDINNLYNPLNQNSHGLPIKVASDTYGIATDIVCVDIILKHSLIEMKDVIINRLPILHALGIKKLVLPLFEASDIGDHQWDIYRTPLSDLCKMAQHYSIEICLETICSMSDLAHCIHQVGEPNLKICLDTGNLINVNIDPAAFVLHFGALISHVHLKDRNAIGDNVKIGTGLVDFKQVLTNLCDTKYAGDFTFETVRGESPAQTARDNINYINGTLYDQSKSALR